MSSRKRTNANNGSSPRKRKSRFGDDKTTTKEDIKAATAQMKASLQEQLASMKSLLNQKNVDAAASIGRRARGFMPAPLVLDEHGRHVDHTGKVIKEKIAPQTTLKANKTATVVDNPYLAHQIADKSDRLDVLDPRLQTRKRES